MEQVSDSNSKNMLSIKDTNPFFFTVRFYLTVSIFELASFSRIVWGCMILTGQALAMCTGSLSMTRGG